MGCRGEMALFLALLCLLWSQTIQGTRWISPEEEADLKAQLKILNKPYVKSIKDDHGNTFDCVDMYKQPAFDHPLLKNHTIQMPNISYAEKKVSASTKGKQINFGFKEGCPPGTVLIRRTTLEDLIRARKNTHYLSTKMETNSRLSRAYLIMADMKFYGARADMNVFNHQISVNQVSGAQVIVGKGDRGPKNYFNTLNFGWRIEYQATGDNLTHFFTHWTSDGYQKTGCYNMLCPGFIQLSKVMAPGMILPGKSFFTFNTYKEPDNGNWLLVREDNAYQRGYDLIGYWPNEIFNNMADCSTVQMGGYVYSPLDEPSPPMGSGVSPSPHMGRSAEFRKVELLQGNGDPVKPSEAKVMYFGYDRALSEYYQAGRGTYNVTGYLFQYGGPGGWKGK